MLRTLFAGTILAGALAGSAMAQAPDAGCALPSEPKGIPYTLQTLDEWIARFTARGRIMLEEKQLTFHIERYGNTAHLWSSYALYSDGKQVARGINSSQAINNDKVANTRPTFALLDAPHQGSPLSVRYAVEVASDSAFAGKLAVWQFDETPGQTSSCRREQMNPSAGYRWLDFALLLIALFAASLMLWRATDA